MRLIIIRHGKAETDSSTGRDEDRALTDRGRAQAKYLVHELRRRESIPDVILSSGHVRAWDTATILAEAMGCQLVHEPTLELGHSSSEVIDVVAKMALGFGVLTSPAERVGPPRTVALVGHNPQIERLAAVFLNGIGGTGPSFRTGEMVAVIWNPSEGLGNAMLAFTARHDDE